MPCGKKLTLKILTGQKFSLSVKFGWADSNNLKFAINLIFCINFADNFSKNLSKFFDIFLLKFLLRISEIEILTQKCSQRPVL